MDDRRGWREERSTVGVMPLSRSLQHKTTAEAGWYSNGMKESHFLGRETETETAALALERVSKRGKNTQTVRKSSTVS